jgi:long-chain acyl-CoA synthetase
MRTDTLPHLLRARAAKYGARTALREKEFGIWNEISWIEYAARVRRFALGLTELGLNKGDHVCILAENEPKWLIADLAAQSVGAVSIGVYPTNPSPEAKYIIAHSESVLVVCGDQEQVDKVLVAKSDLPLVKKIIVMDMKGLRKYKAPLLMPFEDVEQLGRAKDEQAPGAFERILDQVKSDDIAVMVYTSGTTGPPKGAMIRHEHVLNMVNAMAAVVGQREDDEIVSYLPLCHVAERMMSVGLPLNSGATVNFAESVDTVTMAMTEVYPTFFFAVPRIWEKMMAGIMIKMKDAGRLKKLVYGLCLPIGKKAAECRLSHRPVPLSLRIAYWFAYVALLRHLKKELGLLRVKIALSGAAPISPEVLKFHHSLGIEVLELYGMTEETGVATSNLPGEAKLGTVGKPLPGVELKIAEDGEILARCNHIFAGYWKDPDATAKTIRGGWLHTGDVGVIDSEGRLTITDRKKEIIITSGGKNIAPSEIENRLKCSPYINEAIVVGDRRNYLTALIQIEYDNVAKWAQERGIAYTTFKSLAQHSEVFELIRGEVMEANKDFAQVETVKKFRLLDKELDHDDNELTATLKLRRKTIYEKFHDVIEDMYKSPR